MTHCQVVSPPSSRLENLYRTFNSCIDSSFHFPELPTGGKPNPDSTIITFRVSDGSLQYSETVHWFHDWYGDPDKRIVSIAVARHHDGYILRFPDVADFLINTGNFEVTCFPHQGIPPNSIRHLFLDQVVPRLIGHEGNLIVHASAIVLSSGSAVAFLGNSGWGKSTLAFSFYRQGAHILTDDSLLLLEQGGRLTGIPAYAGARLWQDSVDSLFPGRTNLEPVSHHSAKKRLVLDSTRPHNTPVEISAIFCLNDPEKHPAKGEIVAERIKGAEAVMTLIKRAFVIDVTDVRTVARQFISASRIASTGPMVYSLSYERNFDRLGKVQSAILDKVNELSSLNSRASSSGVDKSRLSKSVA